MLKPKQIINFQFDNITAKKFLRSFNNFLMIRPFLYTNRLSQYYNNNNKTREINKEPQELKNIKRKYFVHVYSNERFLKKTGIDIFKFLGQISNTQENSELFISLINKIKNAPTLGRKVKQFKKKLI